MTKLVCKSERERYSSSSSSMLTTTKSHFDLSALPSDVVARIAASFKRRDLMAASSVCRAWRDELKPLLEARIYIKRGQKLKKVKSYKESLKAFFDGAALGSTRALVNAGVLYFRIGNSKEAILCYERAAELGDIRAMHFLATYWQLRGDNRHLNGCTELLWLAMFLLIAYLDIVSTKVMGSERISNKRHTGMNKRVLRPSQQA